MTLEYKHLLPENFKPDSRVWVYQSNRLFSLQEALEIESLSESFVDDWTSHGADVKGYVNLFFGQFLVLIADESQATVSGCSTDASVRFVKELGTRFEVDFFNRTLLAFVIENKIQLLPMNQLQYAYDHGFINGRTLYFNNTVLSKADLENSWLMPLEESWLPTKLKLTSSADPVKSS